MEGVDDNKDNVEVQFLKESTHHQEEDDNTLRIDMDKNNNKTYERSDHGNNKNDDGDDGNGDSTVDDENGRNKQVVDQKKEGRETSTSIAISPSSPVRIDPSSCVSLDDDYGFLQRQAMRMARYPKTYFWIALGISFVLSCIGILMDDFSLTTDSTGWHSRGTIIANRQTQLMLVRMNQYYLLHGGNKAWDDLLNNIQEGWETSAYHNDDDYSELISRAGRKQCRRRRSVSEEEDALNEVVSSTKSLDPQWRVHKTKTNDDTSNKKMQKQGRYHQISAMPPSSSITHEQSVSFLHRRLREEQELLGTESGWEDCDISMYANEHLMTESHLWPVWRTEKENHHHRHHHHNHYRSALDGDVLRDLCISEQNTQRILEANGLCIRCNKNNEMNIKCLPPYSIVMYARVIVPGGLLMNCTTLGDVWSNGLYQNLTELEWMECVRELEQSNMINESTMSQSCGQIFFPTLLDSKYMDTGIVQYTSSVFSTKPDVVGTLYYDHIHAFDRGTHLIRGAYDTQYQEFAQLMAETAVEHDLVLVIGSAFITAVAIMIHTRSVFLTFVGLVQIALSFPLSYCIYRYVGQVEYFPFVAFIGIFIVFAFGADHIFVSVDKWKNTRIALCHSSSASSSSQHPNAVVPTTEQVAAIALPNAAKAMFLTTSTTCAAFFGTAICPVAPIRLFAVFCGLLIVFDYILDVLLIFPCLCIYDHYLQKTGSCCMNVSYYRRKRIVDYGEGEIETSNSKQGGCANEEEQNQKGGQSNLPKVTIMGQQQQPPPPQQQNCLAGKEAPIMNTTNDDENSNIDPNGTKRIVSGSSSSSSSSNNSSSSNMSFIRLTLSRYYQLLHLLRWPILVVSILAIGFCSFYATKLSAPTTSNVRILSPGIEYEIAAKWRSNLFSEEILKREGSRSSIIWGTQPADTGNYHNPKIWSQLVLDETFDPSTERAQIYLRDFCPTLFQQEFANRIHANEVCSMNKFDEWLYRQSQSISPEQIYTSYCVDNDSDFDTTHTNTTTRPPSPTATTFSTALPIPQHIFHPCLTAWAQEKNDKHILSRNGIVRIIHLSFRSRVQFHSPDSELRKEWHLIEDWMDSMQNQEDGGHAPPEVANAYFSSLVFWWYDTNSQTMQTAYGAAAIALAASAAVILLSSWSLTMTAFSVISVAYVLTSVSSVMVGIGWSLGFLECICFAILVGVSVDFIIHFCHAYVTAEESFLSDSSSSRSSSRISHRSRTKNNGDGSGDGTGKSKKNNDSGDGTNPDDDHHQHHCHSSSSMEKHESEKSTTGRRRELNRHERTLSALILMGPSILAAAFTSLSAAIIMLFTVIVFFQKFAIVLFFTIIQATIGSLVILLTLTDCLGPSNPTYVMDKIVEHISNLCNHNNHNHTHNNNLSNNNNSRNNETKENENSSSNKNNNCINESNKKNNSSSNNNNNNNNTNNNSNHDGDYYETGGDII